MSKSVVVLTSKSTVDPCGAPPRVPTKASSTVYAGNQPVVRQGDNYLPHACPNAPPHTAIASAGSATVFVNNKPAHREDDAISCGSTGDNGITSVQIG
jgi:uncharacterized Zn-binding protein involved in type VI secretion